MAIVYSFNSKNKRKPFIFKNVNIALITINILVFIIFSILISKGILPIDSIAIKPSNVLQGKYLWTFLTSIFMHAGFFHLFVNMLSLVFVGPLIERIVGKRRYILFYLLSGIFAGLFFVLMSLIFVGDFEAYAVGASGALFGLIGLLMVLTPNLPVYLMFVPIPIKMKYAAPGMLIILWLISFTESVSIGNTAHLGGLIAGIFYGIYLRKKYKNKTRYISKHFS
jgi:membrane associated rhomboid family serine protease